MASSLASLRAVARQCSFSTKGLDNNLGQTVWRPDLHCGVLESKNHGGGGAAQKWSLPVAHLGQALWSLRYLTVPCTKYGTKYISCMTLYAFLAIRRGASQRFVLN
jgi:hypothetical protein